MLEKVDINESTFKRIGIRGLKKLLLDLTTLKFLTLVFVGYLTLSKVVGDFVGVGAMLALLGIREGFEYLSGKNGYTATTRTRVTFDPSDGGNKKVP
jgi:hypothetical protein